MIDLLFSLITDFFSLASSLTNGGYDILHNIMMQAVPSWLDLMVTNLVDKWGAHVISNIYRLTDTLISQKGTLVYTAKQIAGICVLFYLGYEMWPVILGRKTPDVLALFRPFLIAMVLNAWTPFISAMRTPGRTLESTGKAFYEANWSKMSNLEKECEKMQVQLNIKRDSILAIHMEQLRGIKDAALSYENYDTNHEDGEGFLGWITHEIEDVWQGKPPADADRLLGAKDVAAKLLAEVGKKLLDDIGQYISSWIEKILKWISILFLNFNFLGMLMIGQIAMGVLAIFGPVMFAISITEVWHNAWADWMMKFFSYSMYAFLSYLVMGYIYGIVYYELLAYKGQLTIALNANWDGYTASFGRQFGLLVNWLVALWVGGYCMKFVPELAGMIFNITGSGAAAGAADAMKSGMNSTVGLVRKVVR